MSGPRPQLDSQALIYHIDILLFALTSLLVLLRLPRFLARLWRFSEWTTGHWLSRKVLAEHPTRRVTFHESSSPDDLSTNDNHTLTMEKYAEAERVSKKGTPVKLCFTRPLDTWIVDFPFMHYGRLPVCADLSVGLQDEPVHGPRKIWVD
ncbi:hypothetical protein E1B28_007262 [Marasmius oreades]|uniref:Uncharacterized protein n=1 Tax=Marasmius oreades TaxID=181124 RepID=A0A9P7S1A7_9AGAR|nr:uncharacterized protein E1B28_007262 [Marasmius oreades]KAG7093596.1 hypothetical protein E1B28_007262 [Marasmius oreades]